MPEVVVYGPSYSAYTRTVRLTLIEKGVAFELSDVDFSRGEGMPKEHFARHPFGKVPAFRHDGFMLFETSAICRYVDAAFDGPSLQPTAPRDIGRMTQIIAVLDAYLSLPIRMGLTSQLVTGPRLGVAPDTAVVTQTVKKLQTGLPALAQLMGNGDYLVGDRLTLADLHAAPLVDFLTMSAEGRELLGLTPQITEWWQRMSIRPSITETSPGGPMFED